MQMTNYDVVYFRLHCKEYLTLVFLKIVACFLL